jgi:phosphoribosylformimino-5-aminoimidazole carboxamide ribotide isomerase
MLIPSIDLMGGKIVQLVQGEKKALEFDDFKYWIDRFAQYPLVQLIDLDAAMSKNNNSALVANLCKQLPCQVGGGVRGVARARELLALGAHRVILGSSLIKDGRVDPAFAQECAHQLGSERLTFAIDSRGGKVSIHGWKEATTVGPQEMMRALESWCAAFLYTHIDTEGTMTGFPMDVARSLRAETTKQLIVAGGIRSMEEVSELHALGADAVVGIAIYTGAITA